MTSRSGQDLVTCALRTCLIVSIRAATWAVFTRISGVPGSTPDLARTSDRGTRCVPLTVTERTTSSGEPNRTQTAAADDAGRREGEERHPPAAAPRVLSVNTRSRAVTSGFTRRGSRRPR